MGQLIKRKLFQLLIITITLLVVKLICVNYMFDDFYLGYFFFDLFITYIILLPTIWSKSKKLEFIYYIIVSILFGILYVVNASYFDVKTDIFSLTYLNLMGEGMSVIRFEMLDYVFIFNNVKVILLGILALYYFTFKFKYKEVEFKFPYIKVLITFFTTLVVLILSTFSGYKIYDKIEKQSVDYITIEKILNYRNLGMLGYYWREFDYIYLHDKEIEEPDDPNDGETPDILPTDDFFGSLKDYNVITIMIETGSELMVNETLTPNLYKLLNDGIYAEENYCKNGTNVSEYIGIAGSYPTIGVTINSEKKVEFSLPEIIKNEYKTLYFHDVHKERDIYQRYDLMPMLGFEESYFQEQLRPNTPPWNWGGDYTLDTVTIEPVCDTLINLEDDEPFYAFWSTLQTHGPYNDKRANLNTLKAKYGEKFEEAKEAGLWKNPITNPLYENKMKEMEVFMLAAMDFDASLGIMFDRLQKANILDETLFVLYGDHNIYYDDLGPLLYGHEDQYHSDMYETILGFYNKNLTNLYKQKFNTTSITQFTSPYVIVPTILDLLGYNQKDTYYLSPSIFDESFKQTQVFYSNAMSASFNNEFFFYGFEVLPQFTRDNFNSDIEYEEYNSNLEVRQTEFLDAIRLQKEKISNVDTYYKAFNK